MPLEDLTIALHVTRKQALMLEEALYLLTWELEAAANSLKVNHNLPVSGALLAKNAMDALELLKALVAANGGASGTSQTNHDATSLAQDYYQGRGDK